MFKIVYKGKMLFLANLITAHGCPWALPSKMTKPREQYPMQSIWKAPTKSFITFRRKTFEDLRTTDQRRSDLESLEASLTQCISFFIRQTTPRVKAGLLLESEKCSKYPNHCKLSAETLQGNGRLSVFISSLSENPLLKTKNSTCKIKM